MTKKEDTSSKQKTDVLLISLQVTETRTGPLGCSNYDNLDTVSSVLVHSPENKVQLQGKICFHNHCCEMDAFVAFVNGIYLNSMNLKCFS